MSSIFFNGSISLFRSSVFAKATSKAQAFLEADPYYDMSNIPLNTYKAKEPHIGKIISVKRIVGAQATGETCDIVIDHFGKMPYWEGQSYGVIPPGLFFERSSFFYGVTLTWEIIV